MTTPLYEHNCNECVFLGTFDNKDLYYCPRMTIIIARNSSECGDYQSGIAFIGYDIHLGVGHFIAKRKGLIK